ncbi:MAG TPA: hypothetical protein VH643_32420 [Gemmataceae bacterium]|jgi:hypothetical protein
MRSPISIQALERGADKGVFRLSCGCLFFALLFLAAGCNRQPRSAAHADVSGKVLLQGQPLPGGRVTFTAVKGGFSSTGDIKEDGSYRINAPVGEVMVGVDNSMLQKTRRGAPKQQPRLRPPGAEEEHPIKGRWVNIPSQYSDPQTSGLKYTVTSGAQNHDIELAANPAPAPGAPGP